MPVVETDSEDARKEREILLDSQLHQQVKVNLKHNQEKALLDQEAEEEKQLTFSNLEEQSVQQLQHAIKKKELEFQRELAEKQSSVSVSESDKLIEAHQKEMEALKEHLEAEKLQQKQVFHYTFVTFSNLLISSIVKFSF